MAGLSRDIFDIIQSLSPGELSSVVDEGWKSKHSPTKGEVIPKYVALVKYFRIQLDFDDKAAKKHFGYENKPPSRWRNLKRDTIKNIEKAILKSDRQDNPQRAIQKSIILVQEYIERGIWKRADHLLESAIMLAHNAQEHGFMVTLLDLKQRIIAASYANSKTLFPALQKAREIAANHLAEEHLLQTLSYKIHHEVKAGRSSSLETISEILEHPVLNSQTFSSYKGEMLCLKIKRRGYFLLKDTPNYLKTLRAGKLLFWEKQKYWYDHAFWQSGVAFLCEDANFSSLQHRFEDTKLAIDELDRLKNSFSLSPIAQVELEGRILLAKVLHARYILSPDVLKKLSQEVHSWYVGGKGRGSEDLALRLVKQASLIAFFAGDYSTSVKLIYRFCTKEQSRFRPNLTSFFWVFKLIIRMQTKSFTILRKEIKSCKKFLQEYEPTNVFYESILDLATIAAQKGEEEQRRGNVNNKLKKLLTLLESPAYSEYENFFPFTLWIRSALQEIELLVLLQENNPPVREL